LKELTAEFGKGFSADLLYYSGNFHPAFLEKTSRTAGRLIWMHYKIPNQYSQYRSSHGYPSVPFSKSSKPNESILNKNEIVPTF
jgi:hypothetical protein